jgi:histidinol-phosphatase (PHP family)
MLYEMHMHTPLCRHAEGLPGEYAAVAEKRGLRGIVVTCHNPLPGGMAQATRMLPEEWPGYLQMVEEARAAWAGRVDVRLGLECDWLPGLNDFLDKQLASAHFHHVLGSVHPQLPEYRQMYWKGRSLEYFKLYYTHLAAAAESRLFDTLAHPDLVKNVLPTKWRPERILSHVRHCLDRIAATGVAMELNTSGRYKPVPEFNPGQWMLRQMQERRIPCVIGADAHQPGRVGDLFVEALDALEQAGYTHVSYFLDRRRRDVPIESARSSLLCGATR